MSSSRSGAMPVHSESEKPMTNSSSAIERRSPSSPSIRGTGAAGLATCRNVVIAAQPSEVGGGAPRRHPPEDGGAPRRHPPEDGGAPRRHPPEDGGAPRPHPPEDSSRARLGFGLAGGGTRRRELVAHHVAARLLERAVERRL